MLRPPSHPTAIRAAQERTLTRLRRGLAPTAIGTRFHLGEGDNERFRATVPMQEYADYASAVDQVAAGAADVLFRGRAVALAQTSGTTREAHSGERYIPQNAALLAHHRRGGTLALARVLRQAPAVLAGRMLMLGGCTALEHHRAVPCGDLSGICAASLPSWIRWAYEPGAAIAAEPDWERRLSAMAAHLPRRDIRLISGIPAWLLMLCDRLGRPARSVWPNLRACIHGGHAVEPFLATLGNHLAADTVMQEVYPASEAFIAVGQRPWRLGDGRPSALQLLTDHGVYLEFRCDDGRIVGAADLEPGGLYQVLVTTPGGLLRYRIGDVVRAEGPGLIRVAGRIRNRISVFGEHVEGDALARAIAVAASATGAAVAHYHVAPLLPTPLDPRGAHEWLVEFSQKPADFSMFSTCIDDELRRSVLDYAAHRDGGQLRMPELRPLPSGTFHAWLAASGRLGGQRKVPVAWPDRTIADQLSQHLPESQP